MTLHKAIKSICICGGGSLGTVCATLFSSMGITVNLLTGHSSDWNHYLIVEDCKGSIFKGHLDKISSYPEDVVPTSDLIFLCLPGFLIEETLSKLAKYLKPKAIVGSVVSSTGFFFAAHKIIPQTTIFGFQRVPFIARVGIYGHSAFLLGYKTSLNIAVENSENPEWLVQILSELFKTPINLLDSFYEAALTNSNPILHTGRLYSMWKDFNKDGSTTPSMFYADWNDEASQIIISMDYEFQNLLKKLGIKSESIPTLLNYYESTDAISLSQKIRSIPAFKNIPAPMIKKGAKWYPDYSSRYFTEDFPYGLKFIRDLANTLDVSIPTIDKVYKWGMDKLNSKRLH